MHPQKISDVQLSFHRQRGERWVPTIQYMNPVNMVTKNHCPREAHMIKVVWLYSPVLLTRGQPWQCDRVGLTVGNREVSHAECWRQNGTLQAQVDTINTFMCTYKLYISWSYILLCARAVSTVCYDARIPPASNWTMRPALYFISRPRFNSKRPWNCLVQFHSNCGIF